MGCDIHSVIQRKGYRGWETVALDVGDDRNYDSFAVYANVRNGRAFAGVSTGEGWIPISEPRGLPVDFATRALDEEETRGNTAYQWMGDHSHSWLLLSELRAKWNEFEGVAYTLHGIVERKHWEQTLRIGKEPQEWCGGVSGGGILVVDEAVAPHSSAGTHIRCKWQVPARDCLITMRNHIEIMSAIAKAENLGDDALRLVFGFDS